MKRLLFLNVSHNFIFKLYGKNNSIVINLDTNKILQQVLAENLVSLKSESR